MASVRLLPIPKGTVSVQLLDPLHYESFHTALSRLLSTDIAKETLSQLMDGLPLLRVLRGTTAVNNLKNAPVLQHTQLCPGAEKLAEEFMATFDANLLLFDATLLQAFQNSEPDSDQFLFRLLELLARAVHCIAVSIQVNATKCHIGDIEAATNYHQPPAMIPVGRNIRAYPSPPPHGSLFFHRGYRAHEQYPYGKADMAGFWAEDRIFGGVVLFDRGASGTEANCVWLHSGRKLWTKRIWKPLDWQLRSMRKFFAGSSLEAISSEADEWEKKLSPKLLHEMEEDWKMIFPFFCEVDNLERHDDWDAFAYHNIYRDPWERRIPPTKPTMCTRNTFDYPELLPTLEAMIYDPAPATVPTLEDLYFPLSLTNKTEEGSVQASVSATGPENTTSEPSGAATGSQMESDDSSSQHSSRSSRNSSPPASSVWDSPSLKAALPLQQPGPDASRSADGVGSEVAER